MMERACYTMAREQWRAGKEEEEAGAKRQRPHEDPELLLLIVKETANRLMSGPSHAQLENPHDEEEGGQSCPAALREIGGLDISGLMQYGFAELRRRGGYNMSGTVGYMLATLLEHIYLQRHIGSAAVEVASLEKTLKAQAVNFGVKIEALRLPPVHGVVADTGAADITVTENLWIDASGPVLSAGMIDSEMGVISLSTGPNLAESCSPLRVQELRRIYQHELAYLNLVLACVQHNALLLDPQVRQKELTDVMFVGPSRDMIAGDHGALVMRKLRETAELSGPSRGDRSANTATQRKAKAGEPGFIDMSRYSQNHLQTPQTHLGPVLVAIGKLHSEKSAALCNTTRPAESDRLTRVLRYNLLVCSSTFLNTSARDLSVRVQAAKASLVLRSVAALIPTEITPFDCTVGRKPSLIERDGLVGNVFSFPNTLDLLQLRASASIQDHSAAVANVLSQVAQRSSEGLQISDANEHEVNSSVDLPFLYDGPASNALRIIHWLTVLLTLRYALSTLSGDPVSVVRMQRRTRYASFEELDEAQDKTQDRLSSMDPTFEAFEELCGELARLAWRLDGLGGEAARDPWQVIPVLRAEAAIAQQQVLLLLKRASRLVGQSCGPAAAHATWDTELALSWVSIFQPESGTAPLASLATFGRAGSTESDARLHVESTRKAGAMRFQLTTLHEDMRRYMRELHPELRGPQPLQRSFLSALLQPMEDSVPRSLIGHSGDIQAFLPQESRLLWSHPQMPLLELVSCVYTLPEERRQEIAELHNVLQEERKAFHSFQQVKAQSAEAATADAEFLGCLLLLEVLADRIAFGQLASSSLGKPAVPFALKKQFDSVLIPGEFAGLEDVGGLSPTSKREVSAEGVANGVKAVRQRLWDLVLRLDSTLVAFAGLRLRNELTAAAEVRHRAEGNTAGTIARPLAAGSLHAEKVDSLLHALNGLRVSGTFVRMDPDGNGERAYVFRESDLNMCLGSLMSALPDWGARASQSRGWLAEALLLGQHIWLVSHTKALQWEQLEVKAGAESQRREVRGRAAVASRGCRLVLEVDRLRRVVRELEFASSEIEQRLGCEVWDKARAALSLLASTLASRTGHFQERHSGSSNDLAGRLRGLREHVTSCLAALASKNFAVQESAARGRRSALTSGNSVESEARDTVQEGQQPLPVSKGMHLKLRGVARRADLEQLQLKIESLKRRQVYARTFHHLKCETLRQRCGEQMKVLRMTLESNSELSERLAHALQSERVTSDGFSANARTISLSEQRIEELRAQVESNTEQHSRLQNWRKSKVKQLAYGKRAVSEHQRKGRSDAAGLLGELHEKAELLRQLQQEHLAKEAMLETAARQGRQHSAQASQELQRRRLAKEVTRQELQKLRADVERGGLSDDERLRIWHGRIAEASRRLEELQEENQQLRNMLPSASAGAVES